MYENAANSQLGYGQTKDASPRMTIGNYLGDLSNRLEETDKLVSGLQDRLSMIYVPQPPVPTGSDNRIVGVAIRSNLAEQIAGLESQVRRLNARLGELLQQIEL
jgi:hypothetical protein